MKKIGIVYWSGTGNTEQMATYLAESVKAAGGEAELLLPDAFDAGKVGDYDALAFGCPSMGDEELEEAEFAPMFEGVESALSGCKVGLFGSYGWGDGAWMRDWEERASGKGATVVGTVIANYEPDGDAEAELKTIAEKLIA